MVLGVNGAEELVGDKGHGTEASHDIHGLVIHERCGVHGTLGTELQESVDGDGVLGDEEVFVKIKVNRDCKEG